VLDSAALRARLGGVRDRIARAAGRVGRDPASVRLIAVSKTFSVDHVRAAADLGQVDFGENKVQEALPKMDATSDLPLTWHLIGHLQSNKARRAGARFDAIHSVDSPDLVARLDESALSAGRQVDLLVQVDLAGEATKHGASRDALLPILQAGASCRAAHIVGLMALPPAVAEPEAARPYFRALVAVRNELVGHGVDPVALAELSMGMSHDFEVAVAEGATMVRVGSAIFGERSYV
jgi:PLP dependent protein